MLKKCNVAASRSQNNHRNADLFQANCKKQDDGFPAVTIMMEQSLYFFKMQFSSGSWKENILWQLWEKIAVIRNPDRKACDFSLHTACNFNKQLAIGFSSVI